jgi:hypothetical protein
MFKERPIVVSAYVVCTVMALARGRSVLLGADDGAEAEPGDQRLAAAIFRQAADAGALQSHPREENFLRYILNSLIIALSSMTGDPVHVTSRASSSRSTNFPGAASCSPSSWRPPSSRSRSTSSRST